MATATSLLPASLVTLCTVGGVWIVHKGRQVSTIICCYDSVQVILCTHVYIAIMQLHCNVIKPPLLTFVGITILLGRLQWKRPSLKSIVLQYKVMESQSSI